MLQYLVNYKWAWLQCCSMAQKTTDDSTYTKNHTVDTDDIRRFLEEHVDTYVFGVAKNHVPGSSDYNAVVGDLNSIPNFGTMPVNFDRLEGCESERGNSLIRIHMSED